MDHQKVGFANRILAFFLSIFVAVTLIIAQFTFPLELVLLNSQSYVPVIENEEFADRYPEIMANMLISQIYDVSIAGTLPAIFSNRDAFQSILIKFIPEEWSKDTILNFTNQFIDYLNFRLPTKAMDIEISGIKSDLILNSQNIAEDYINSLVNCNSNVFREQGQFSTVFDLPPCKPDRSLMPMTIELTSKYTEDLFNQLPSQFSIADATAISNNSANDNYFFYSISRWVLRLLPLITLLLLIMIAVLLKRERSVMLRWIGRLLVITSAFTLILLTIVLIGFDQLIAMTINRFLGKLIGGFDVLLLGFIQAVGYQTVVWVIVSLIITLVFGLILSLMAKVFLPKKADSEIDPNIDNTGIDGNQVLAKDIAPQTIEEIEEEEKKQDEEGN